MSDILVVAAHPQLEHSRVTRALVRAVQRQRPDVVLHDLYARYPDYYIDVEAEQAALDRARLVVWLHPTFWYSMPPLMKLWIDEVLAFGWAYGPGGTALRGKGLWLVTSTGAGPEAYAEGGRHGHPFEAFLLPWQQTAMLTGMQALEPLVHHGAHRSEEGALQAHVQAFLHGLDAARVGGEVDYSRCTVPGDERPDQAALALAGAPSRL